jgi:prepilin-type N-terminal cleavage/methylation domain-containing protein
MNIRQQIGFSLIELMMAVAILAIISAIAIPLYEGYIAESRAGAAVKDIRQMQLILDDLASDNDLAAVDGGNTTVRGVYADAAGNMTVGAIAACPPAAGVSPKPWCDPWDSIYRYQRPNAASQTYALFSQGPDHTSGTADDVSK